MKGATPMSVEQELIEEKGDWLLFGCSKRCLSPSFRQLRIDEKRGQARFPDNRKTSQSPFFCT